MQVYVCVCMCVISLSDPKLAQRCTLVVYIYRVCVCVIILYRTQKYARQTFNIFFSMRRLSLLTRSLNGRRLPPPTHKALEPFSRCHRVHSHSADPFPTRPPPLPHPSQPYGAKPQPETLIQSVSPLHTPPTTPNKEN